MLISVHAYLFSSLLSFLSFIALLSAYVIPITIHSCPLFIFLLYSQYHDYLSPFFYIYGRREGKIRESEMIYVLIQPLHWAPLIFSLVKCHRCVIVIKSYITGCWNVTLGDMTDLLCPTLKSVFLFHSHLGKVISLLCNLVFFFLLRHKDACTCSVHMSAFQWAAVTFSVKRELRDNC